MEGKDDLNINAIYQKEMLLNSRKMRNFLYISFFNLFLGAVSLIMFYSFFMKSNYSGMIQYENIFQVFNMIGVTELGMVCVMVPLLTAGSIAGEKERKTLDSLLASNLVSYEVIIGKIFSSIGIIMHLIVSSFPIVSIVFSIGGVKITDIVKLFALCLVAAIYIGSVGVFFSAWIKRTIAATVGTYIYVLSTVFGTVFLVRIFNIFWSSNNLAVKYGGSFEQEKFMYIGLLNPFFSLSEVTCVKNKVSSLYQISLIKDSSKSWFGLSITVQLILALIFILAASKKLIPSKRKCQKQK
ncbi:ABC transporter permease [Anaeromicropila populeti]|uniref:ABC-2 family transporter protein n=1 Tax=Anaeromicropila populeti TaxID=37658 RepID=A0A1I6HR97_9FIRM|nr:ABC transporter permease subunit [Anaeromicropila populeti]SFR56976.1 hypothetical protein SAMN05661086_00188 [Anaeromicropila populeti]